jgi:hypothetical protein
MLSGLPPMQQAAIGDCLSFDCQWRGQIVPNAGEKVYQPG